MKTTIDQTLKSTDTEEYIDIIFYRRVGYLVARVAEKMHLTPNAITIISIFWGVLAGHLMMYNAFWINIGGIAALVFANILDSADGQLARMTNNKTRLGRILDGLAGNLWFVSIYIHLGIRMQSDGFGLWIWALGAVTGLFHVFQAAIADYYRNGHLFFVKGINGSEFDNSSNMNTLYHNLSWKNEFFYKLFMASYVNYTKEQELFTRHLGMLISKIKITYLNGVPEWLRQGFVTENRPLMKYTNILSFNTRAIALFIAVLANIPVAYWVFEITILNGILFYMVHKQENISKKYIRLIDEKGGTIAE